jgi:hypothetical protein
MKGNEMDKMEKQLRDVLGTDAVDALEGLVKSEQLNMQTRGRLVGEIMEGLAAPALPKDIEERLAEASKDAGPADMVLVVPPGPSKLGYFPRMPDIGRGLKSPIIYCIPAEMPAREMEQRMGMAPTISEAGMEMLKELGPPIAIDCQMNPDGSLSFGVVPPDADHPPLEVFDGTYWYDRVRESQELPTFGTLDSFSEFDSKQPPQQASLVSRLVLKPNQPHPEGGPKVDIMEVASYADKPKAGDPLDLFRSIGKVELRPEHKLDSILLSPLPETDVKFVTIHRGKNRNNEPGEITIDPSMKLTDEQEKEGE